MSNYHSNLVPTNAGRRIVFYSLARTWGVVLVVALVVVAGITLFMRGEANRCRRKIAELRDQSCGTEALCEEAERLVSEVGRLKSEWDQVSGLSNAEVPGYFLAKLSVATQPYIHRLRLTSIIIRQADIAESADGQVEKVTIDLVGIAANTPTIGQFLGSVRDLEFVERAELVSTQSSSDGIESRTFQIQATAHVHAIREFPGEISP